MTFAKRIAFKPLGFRFLEGFGKEPLGSFHRVRNGESVIPEEPGREHLLSFGPPFRKWDKAFVELASVLHPSEQIAFNATDPDFHDPEWKEFAVRR